LSLFWSSKCGWFRLLPRHNNNNTIAQHSIASPTFIMPPRDQSFSMLGESSSSLFSRKSCLSSSGNNSSSSSLKEAGVQFRPRVKFLEVPNRDTYSKLEKKSLWWSRNELQSMRESANQKGESLRWAGDTFSSGSNDSTLGLITEAEEAHQVTIVRTMRSAVFLEQERQWAAGVDHPIRMAQKCRACTDLCSWAAGDRGKRLAQEIYPAQDPPAASGQEAATSKKNTEASQEVSATAARGDLRCRSLLISPTPRQPKKKLLQPLESVSAHEPRRMSTMSINSNNNSIKTKKRAPQPLDSASAHEARSSVVTGPLRTVYAPRKSLTSKVTIPAARKPRGRHAGISV
jgi:hypothetical protein